MCGNGLSMEVIKTEITIRDLIESYRNAPRSGVRAYHDALDVRPAYQREFVYNDTEQSLLIESILDGYPIGIMYWGRNAIDPDIEDGDGGETAEWDKYSFEVIDGQQRTISICEYFAADHFAVRGKLFSQLKKDNPEKAKALLDYEITVYQCIGSEESKLNWFKRINIAGKALSAQELRNAVYTGKWLSDAKERFRDGGTAQKQSRPYLKTPKNSAENRDFDWKRWDGLELALQWACGSKKSEDIEAYMAAHRSDENASELKKGFKEVFEWVEDIFQKKHNADNPARKKALLGNDWHELYLRYKDKFDPDVIYEGIEDRHAEPYPEVIQKLENEIERLMNDDEIKNKHGIFWYVLDPENNEHMLNLRTFDANDKTKMYAQQKHRCPVCCSNGYFDQYAQSDMEADHLVPWSKGGKTSIENGAMLCSIHNNLKSNKNVSEQQVKDWLDVLASDGFEDLLAKYEAGEVELNTPKDWLEELKQLP